jgi:hypothetical protein
LQRQNILVKRFREGNVKSLKLIGGKMTEKDKQLAKVKEIKNAAVIDTLKVEIDLLNKKLAHLPELSSQVKIAIDGLRDIRNNTTDRRIEDICIGIMNNIERLGRDK